MILEAPSKLDALGAHELMKSVQNARDSDVELDLGAVTHLGAQALQILIAARKAWQDDGRRLSIVNPSPDALGCLATLGASDLLIIRGPNA